LSPQPDHNEFEALLHAYELGLLSDSDRDRLEEHMLNCAECLKAVAAFEKNADLIVSDPDVRSLLQDLVANPQERRSSEGPERRGIRIGWARYRWVAAAAAILLVALVLKPWEIRIKPSQDVVAAENRLAVLHFENVTDPGDREMQSQMLANLVATDIAESRYVQIVSPRRISAVYRLLAERPELSAEIDIDLEVATRTDARYALAGSLSQRGGETVITARLLEMPGGRVLDTYRVVGDNSDLFGQVDQLSAQVRQSLTLPPDPSSEQDRRVADVTTRSQEAYYHYTRGELYYSQLRRSSAAEEYRRALSFDSTFAMAWYALYLIEHGDQIDKAVAWSAGAGDRERTRILAAKQASEGHVQQAEAELEGLLKRYPDDLEVLYSLGVYAYGRNDFDVAVDYFRRAVEADSLYRLAYNHLAYSYCYSDRLDEAIATLDRYVAIAPHDANPHDSRGDIFAYYGKVDEAIQAYRRALEIDPDFNHSRWYLGHMLLLSGRTEEAAATYRQSVLGHDPDDRANGRLYVAYPALFAGRFTEALALLDDGIGADRLEERKTDIGAKCGVKATILEELGDLPGAIRQVRTGIREQFGRDTVVASSWSVYLGQLLARADSTEQAIGVVEDLKKIENEHFRNWGYRMVQGEIERARGEAETALATFRAAAGVSKDFRTQYALGLAYLEAGDAERARDEFTEMLTIFTATRAMLAISDARVRYYLGIACEQTGQSELAREHLESFLDRWQDATPHVAIMDSAQARLDHLKNREDGA
jgi:tetratricopeptide (TPR) repeat protein